jgi:cell division inhibitor SulA
LWRNFASCAAQVKNLRHNSHHPELHSPGFASSIEYHAVLLLAPLLAQLKKNARFFVDLAHRN